jgi:serine/threonine protein kinase
LDGPIGTDEYMAPEQCEPARGGLGYPADVWALGATMFRAAAGHRAFDHRKTRWPQLTESPRPLLGRLPPVLSELILACLDQDPARRPLPAEFADALEPLMANLPTSRLAGFKIG